MNKKKLKELREELIARQSKIHDQTVDVDRELARLRSDDPTRGTTYLDPGQLVHISPSLAKEYQYNGRLLEQVQKMLEKS